MSASDESKSQAPRYAVDERLIAPETRFEAIDGEVVYVSPADGPHASRHSKLSALLEACVAEGYDAASDMLTRTSEKNDFAPDGSVYPAAPDPESGGRQLEELAFEVVSTQTLSNAGTKAAKLIARGVRRVFALDVERQRALEWSTATDAWTLLHPEAAIEDPALAAPLVIYDLVGAAKADDGVARALLAKRNRVILDALAQDREAGRAEGELEGTIRTLLAFLAARGLTPTAEEAARIRACRDRVTLSRWVIRGATAGSVAAVLAEPDA